MAIFEAVTEIFASDPSILVAGVLLFVFILTLSTFLSSPKPGPNPFTVDTSRKPQELEIDQKARDKVLKQGFVAKNVPENLDAIVIGSGIGGLTTAAILSKVGKKVLVLEQHDQAGGCCHSFIEKGFEFDIGIHYIGEMKSNTVTRLLINQLTEGQLQWVHLEEEFDVVALGEPGKQKFYPFRAGGPKAFKEAILEKFPKEEKAVDKFLALLRDVRVNMKGLVLVKALPKWIVRILSATGALGLMTTYFKHARRTVKEVLDEITDDEDLKAVLSYSWGDYGSYPAHGSFALHSALINHYLYGASYPRGGASEIAYTIIPVIERAGGRVLVRAPVSQIITDKRGNAVGVRVARSSGPVDLFAPLIISDAGVVNTFTKLLAPEVAKKSSITRLIGSKIDSGVGCMSLFVGLNGTTEELQIKPKNIWAYPRNDLSGIIEEFLQKPAEDAASSDVPLLFITFPSAKDPTFQDRYPGKSVCTVITMANWEWFAPWEQEHMSKRGDDYNSVKNQIGRRMCEQVLALYPHLADKVEYFDVGSPVTNKYYIGSARGEIYGLDHTAKRFGNPEVMMHLRPTTDIPNLLITGQDVVSCGFTGAMFGGLLCASTALNRNLYEDLVQLRKTVVKAK
jgi:all-trans-retinol 13,14-reductase